MAGLSWTLFWQVFILIGWLGIWINITMSSGKAELKLKAPNGYSNN